MKVTRITPTAATARGGPRSRDRPRQASCPSCRTTTARRPTAWSTASDRSRATSAGDATSREVGLYDQAFVDTYIHTLKNGGRVIAGPVRRSVPARREGHLRPGQPEPRRSRRHLRARAGRRPRTSSPASTSSRSRSKCPITDIFPDGIPHNGELEAELDRQPAARVVAHHAPGRRRSSTPPTSSPASRASGDCVQVGRNALPLFNAGLVGTQRQTLYLRSSPMNDVTNFGADILFPVLVRDAEALGIYAALGVAAGHGRHAEGPAPGHHQRDQPRAARSRSRTASRATSSRSTPRSTRASRTAGASAAASRRTATR